MYKRLDTAFGWCDLEKSTNNQGGEPPEAEGDQGSVTQFETKLDEDLASASSLKMGDPAAASAAGGGGPGDKGEAPTEDNIRVVCRFRPLNDSEERAGSKFILKFPDEQCASIAVRFLRRS